MRVRIQFRGYLLNGARSKSCYRAKWPRASALRKLGADNPGLETLQARQAGPRQSDSHPGADCSVHYRPAALPGTAASRTSTVSHLLLPGLRAHKQLSESIALA